MNKRRINILTNYIKKIKNARKEKKLKNMIYRLLDMGYTVKAISSILDIEPGYVLNVSQRRAL